MEYYPITVRFGYFLFRKFQSGKLGVGRRSSVVGRRSSVVGRGSSVVGRRSSVVSLVRGFNAF